MMDDRELANRLDRIETKLNEILKIEGYEINEYTQEFSAPNAEDTEADNDEETEKPKPKRREE